MSEIIAFIGLILGGIVLLLFGKRSPSKELLKKEHEIDQQELDEKIEKLREERKKLLAKGEDPIDIPDVKDSKAVVDFFDSYFKDKNESN